MSKDDQADREFRSCFAISQFVMFSSPRNDGQERRRVWRRRFHSSAALFLRAGLGRGGAERLFARVRRDFWNVNSWDVSNGRRFWSARLWHGRCAIVLWSRVLVVARVIISQDVLVVVTVVTVFAAELGFLYRVMLSCEILRCICYICNC